MASRSPTWVLSARLLVPVLGLALAGLQLTAAGPCSTLPWELGAEKIKALLDGDPDLATIFQDTGVASCSPCPTTWSVNITVLRCKQSDGGFCPGIRSRKAKALSNLLNPTYQNGTDPYLQVSVKYRNKPVDPEPLSSDPTVLLEQLRRALTGNKYFSKVQTVLRGPPPGEAVRFVVCKPAIIQLDRRWENAPGQCYTQVQDDLYFKITLTAEQLVNDVFSLVTPTRCLGLCTASLGPRATTEPCGGGVPATCAAGG